MAGQILNSYVQVSSLHMLPSGREMGLKSAVRTIRLQHTVVLSSVWFGLVKAPRKGHQSSRDNVCYFLQNNRNFLKPTLHQIKSREDCVPPHTWAAYVKPMPSRPKIEYGLPRWMHFWDTGMEYQTRPDCQEQASEIPELLTSLIATAADGGNSCYVSLAALTEGHLNQRDT
ncbi:hypothetical protein STEG23_016912 [Scotinomys teguina]